MLDSSWVKVPFMGSVVSVGIQATVTCRGVEGTHTYKKGFITGFEHARESCQVKPEDDQSK